MSNEKYVPKKGDRFLSQIGLRFVIGNVGNQGVEVTCEQTGIMRVIELSSLPLKEWDLLPPPTPQRPKTGIHRVLVPINQLESIYYGNLTFLDIDLSKHNVKTGDFFYIFDGNGRSITRKACFSKKICKDIEVFSIQQLTADEYEQFIQKLPYAND